MLEIHLYPQIFKFAQEHDYSIILAEKQNWYPDLSFVSQEDPNLKFAVDLKTTFAREWNFCEAGRGLV
ncbi:MAG: hypothetical protein OXH81_19950 [Gemmatimonadetes bacterium]|nr:hypothetical protein [Gemmatimonadota bacterium]